MTTLREAAQQALEAWDGGDTEWFKRAYTVMEALRAALAEPEGGGNLPPPLPGDFDHGIGADRFKVVPGAFWWHILIGDSPTEHGKFRSRASAEKMAADLLREFRNGAFVQHEAALAEPVLQTCNCRWDGEVQVQQCTLHEAHVDAIKEWAQRAKFAEKKLAALAEQRLTDMEQKMERSIESLKAALAEPVQEPWVCACGANLYIDAEGKPRSKA